SPRERRGRRPPRPAGEFGHLHSGDRGRPRRTLCDAPAYRGGAVHGRRGRPGADPGPGRGASADRPRAGRLRARGRLVNVARTADELATRSRAVALGTFDGVHLGHRRVLAATVDQAPALTPTVVSFWPHPRLVLGNEVGLLTTLERRLELLADSGVD